MKAPRKIAILVFDNVELLDIAGPHDVFATAAALVETAPSPYEVATAAPRAGMIKTSSALLFQPSCDLETMGAVDTLLIAGGGGIHDLCDDPAIIAWLRRTAPRVRRLGSICTGAFLLAAAGLLDGRRAVTHWNWCDRLSARHPGASVERDPIFINDNGLWTSAGVTAGIDMALAMIEEDEGAAACLAHRAGTRRVPQAAGRAIAIRRQSRLACGLRSAARYGARLDLRQSRSRSLGRGTWPHAPA